MPDAPPDSSTLMDHNSLCTDREARSRTLCSKAMIQFQRLGSISLDIAPQLQWLWHSSATGSFIVGDERTAYALRQNDINRVTQLEAARPFDPNSSFHHPCNLPIPDAYYDELRGHGWRGFHFLKASAYDRLLDAEGRPVGDLLRTFVFGPDYGHCVLHRPSGLVLGLRSGSMQVLNASDDTFPCIGETRTRGRAALAFCAHPNDTLVVYGDNYGNFHAHQFGEDGFGKANKIAAKTKKASAVEFIDSNTLLIGGTGYLESFAYSAGKFSPLHATTGPVRDFSWNHEHKILFVNQGMHGVTAYRYSDAGFSKLGVVTASSAVKQMAVSQCGAYLAVSSQSSSAVTVFATTFADAA